MNKIQVQTLIPYEQSTNKGDKMNGRAIIIAALIIFKIIGVASRAKAEDVYIFYDFDSINEQTEQVR